MAHAKLSPSSSAQWTLCAAAPRRQEGMPDESGDAADYGTVAHDLGEKCLKAGNDDLLDAYKGKFAAVDAVGDVTYFPTKAMCGDSTAHSIDDEMIDGVKVYTEFVRKLAQGGELMVEQRLSIEHITGEEGAKGTSDSVILFPDEICVIDLKFGQGVKVFASEYVSTVAADQNSDRKPNTQLAMYADAAVQEFSAFGDFKRVRIIIVQPRLGHVDEFVMTMDEHNAWIDWIRERAAATRNPDAPAVPSDKACQWCKAKGSCSELQAFSLNEAFGDFDSLEDADVRNVETPELPVVFAKLNLIKGWVKAIEERVYDELNSGHPVIGYKLVDGRKGNRKWASDEKAVELFTSFRLKETEMYNRKVISPSDAEKLLKKESPRRWTKVEPLIKQSDGSPTVVEDSDPRPAIVRGNVADDFEDETQTNPIPAGEAMAEFFS